MTQAGHNHVVVLAHGNGAVHGWAAIERVHVRLHLKVVVRVGALVEDNTARRAVVVEGGRPGVGGKMGGR